MNNRYARIIIMAIWMLVSGLFLVPASLSGAKEKADMWESIEKAIGAASSQEILYQKGKIESVKKKDWKKATVLSLDAKEITILKKGWYTFRVTTKKNKKSLLTVKLKKQTYSLKVNRVTKIEEGYYYLSGKGTAEVVFSMEEGSEVSGKNVSLAEKDEEAYHVWKVVKTTGKKFRLQNVNSEKYIGITETGIVQSDFSKKDTQSVFQAICAENGYFYLYSVGAKKYLRIKEGALCAGNKKRINAMRFAMTKTEEPKSGVSVTGYTYPTSVLLGSAFTLKGIVYSNYTMTSVTACIQNTKKENIIEVTAKPNACEYDLKGIDAAMTFGKLTAGTYWYKVFVTDKKGKEMTAIKRKFTVSAPTVGSAKTLSYNASLIEKIGHQSTGTALEKKACASYALAYCNAILFGTTPSPHDYWLAEETVDCVWSKGGYTTYAYGSEAEVLKAAYAQIAAGKPCILHVTGNTAQHWVTVVGYKNVTALNELSADNFVAIDPWDGVLRTVSDKYKVKTTYRLGYSNS